MRRARGPARALAPHPRQIERASILSGIANSRLTPGLVMQLPRYFSTHWPGPSEPRHSQPARVPAGPNKRGHGLGADDFSSPADAAD